MTKLALIDMNGPLVEEDMTVACARLMYINGEFPDTHYMEMRRYAEDREAGRISHKEMTNKIRTHYLMGISGKLRSKQRSYAGLFAQSGVKLRTEVGFLLGGLKEKGYKLVAFTGTARDIAEPVITERLPYFDELVASELEVQGQRAPRYTGRVPEFNELGTRWQNLERFGKIDFAMADQHTDVPMLQRAGIAVASYPSIELGKEASDRGWLRAPDYQKELIEPVAQIWQELKSNVKGWGKRATAIFDITVTMLKRNVTANFLRYLQDAKAVTFDPKILEKLDHEMDAGKLPYSVYSSLVLDLYSRSLQGKLVKDIDMHASNFVNRGLPAYDYADALRSAVSGGTTVALTSLPFEIVDAMKREGKFDFDYTLCTTLRRDRARFSTGYEKNLLEEENRVKALQEFGKKHGSLETAILFGNSAEDVGPMSLVKAAGVLNPDEKLAVEAEKMRVAGKPVVVYPSKETYKRVLQVA